ncbi:response regulator transcription factor [Paenibacillus rigui]|uniref:DNA-binding response regulator n=1 Tax=Paenibacillus rigui TaxID=554312 RepID=A0A229UQJ2_9BACL|nr:helix-turn-helix domain-containing protein [Paenibacillus rigui]OXM85650.1 DNA-binding response regulator [Paenibacillus rigui]
MLKLMIVDDEAVILKGIEHLVRREDTLFTEIIGVSDSIEALSLMDTFRPDLLITDIQMPGMNGLELIREAQLKQVRRFAILTGYDLFEYARQALRLNVAEYLLKPIDPQELSALLSKLTLEIIEEHQGNQVLPARASKADVPEDINENIKKFKNFVQNNFMRDVSLEEVAAHLELHPNYVCSLLKRETGMTFIHFLQTIRIEKAKSLLIHMPFMPMEQISKTVGFDSPRHFYKMFKKYVGQTPGSYRTSQSL